MEFPDEAAAQRFLDDPELPVVMKAAGVIGTPDIQLTESTQAR